MLKLLGKDSDHFVVGNGLIKSKEELKGNSNGSKGGPNGPSVVGSTKVVTQQKPGSAGKVGDKGAHVLPLTTCPGVNNNTYPKSSREKAETLEGSSGDEQGDTTDYDDARSDTESDDSEPDTTPPRMQRKKSATKQNEPPTPETIKKAPKKNKTQQTKGKGKGKGKDKVETASPASTAATATTENKDKKKEKKKK